jgi:hypothetical protein
MPFANWPILPTARSTIKWLHKPRRLFNMWLLKCAGWD